MTHRRATVLLAVCIAAALWFLWNDPSEAPGSDPVRGEAESDVDRATKRFARQRNAKPTTPFESGWRKRLDTLRRFLSVEDAPEAPSREAVNDEGESPADEALDWERMSDEERAAAGLTRLALYSSKNAANWSVVWEALDSLGHHDLAARAFSMGDRLLDANVNAGKPQMEASAPELRRAERDLMSEIRALDLADQNEHSAAVNVYLGLIEDNLDIEEGGDGSPVDDKIAHEREAALRGLNRRSKEEAEDSEEKQSFSARRTQAEQ